MAQGFARKLEGYDAADLRALVDRALHQALMRRLASRPRPAGASLRLASLNALARRVRATPSKDAVLGVEALGPRPLPERSFFAELR